jgi:mannose/cellobiose epimerase-like protein (N-acyl-D-glucosamine 2-epimerase family)
MKDVREMKHGSSISVIVLQDSATKEIVGKILTQYSDSGVCSSEAWIWDGTLALKTNRICARCSGSGYNKLASNLCNMFRPFFETYSEVSDLDSGILESWFAKHGYIATTIFG